MTDMKANGLRSSVQDARLASPAPENGGTTPNQSGRKMQYNFGKLENVNLRSSTASNYASQVASPRYDGANNDVGSKPRTAMTA
jgi:Ni,Fe-hydrogenase I large subunit